MKPNLYLSLYVVSMQLCRLRVMKQTLFGLIPLIITLILRDFLCGDEPLAATPAAAVCNLQKLHKDVKTNISWFCIVEQLYSPLSGHNTQRAFTSVDLETKLIKLWRGLFSLS